MTEHVIITITPTLDTGQQAAISIREIVQGDRGDKGDRGEKGDQGEMGQVNPLTVRFDKTNDPVFYLGEADPNTEESASLWRIKRIDSSGNVVIVLFADGNDLFDNSWSNHLTLTYS